MKLGPRAKLLLLASLFLLPIAASMVAYLARPEPTANYGELLLPPATITTHPFGRESGGKFEFSEMQGRWILVVSDSGACPAACIEKLTTIRQVRLALGRNAARIERVFVVDDLAAPNRDALAAFEGLNVAVTPAGMALPPGAVNDRAHIYLVDPRGNVMLRWPAKAEMKRMHRDLERLLKASQIG
jgi:cytochrome oxidase Cu insertion factor (SCO1/SenC/PrrC family)